MWVARDKDGSLWLHINKPTKDSVQWIEECEVFLIEPNTFPEVKWSDEEPRELVLKPIKK